MRAMAICCVRSPIIGVRQAVDVTSDEALAKELAAEEEAEAAAAAKPARAIAPSRGLRGARAIAAVAPGGFGFGAFPAAPPPEPEDDEPSVPGGRLDPRAVFRNAQSWRNTDVRLRVSQLSHVDMHSSACFRLMMEREEELCVPNGEFFVFYHRLEPGCWRAFADNVMYAATASRRCCTRCSAWPLSLCAERTRACAGQHVHRANCVPGQDRRSIDTACVRVP
jgi:hypothetical protein